MEPVFTIPYPEYVVAEQFIDIFKKNDGYSIYIPASRQQKGVDLLLVKQYPLYTRSLTIQVKSSKAWMSKKPTKNDVKNGIYPLFTLWYKKFDYESNFSADINIFIGLKPVDVGETKKKTTSAWEPVMLMFTRQQLKDIFDRLNHWSIYFTFDKTGKVFVTRGLEQIEEITNRLFDDDSISEIENIINQENKK